MRASLARTRAIARWAFRKVRIPTNLRTRIRARFSGHKIGGRVELRKVITLHLSGWELPRHQSSDREILSERGLYRELPPMMLAANDAKHFPERGRRTPDSANKYCPSAAGQRAIWQTILHNCQEGKAQSCILELNLNSFQLSFRCC